MSVGSNVETASSHGNEIYPDGKPLLMHILNLTHHSPKINVGQKVGTFVEPSDVDIFDIM